MRVRFVAVITRDGQPAYLRAFVGGGDDDTGEDALRAELRCNMLAHMSLDVFEAAAAGHSAGDDVLLLLVHDGTRVYGRRTPVGVKLVVGVDEEAEGGDVDVNVLLAGVQRAYVAAVAGPFTVGSGYGDGDGEALAPGGRFDVRVRALVE